MSIYGKRIKNEELSTAQIATTSWVDIGGETNVMEHNYIGYCIEKTIQGSSNLQFRLVGLHETGGEEFPLPIKTVGTSSVAVEAAYYELNVDDDVNIYLDWDLNYAFDYVKLQVKVGTLGTAAEVATVNFPDTSAVTDGDYMHITDLAGVTYALALEKTGMYEISTLTFSDKASTTDGDYIMITDQAGTKWAAAANKNGSGVAEVSTLTFSDKAGTTDGDYIMITDSTGTKWAAAANKNGSGVSEVSTLNFPETSALTDGDYIQITAQDGTTYAVALEKSGDYEISTLTFDTKANTTDGDYIMITDQAGTKWGAAANKNGAGVAEVTTLNFPDVAALTDGDYFFIEAYDGTKYACAMEKTGDFEVSTLNFPDTAALTDGDYIQITAQDGTTYAVALEKSGTHEVSTATCPALVGINDGDYFVFTTVDTSTYAVACDTTGAAAATPTGASYTGATEKVYVDISGEVSNVQVAAVIESAFNALPGLSAKATITDAAADGTISFTQLVRGAVADLDEAEKTGAGTSGNLGVATPTPGVDIAADPTGAVWVATTNKVTVSVGDLVNDEDIAARVETALNALSGFTALMTTDDTAADGTMTITQTVRGVTTDPVPHDDDDAGVGTITTAETNAGVDVAADPTGAKWLSADYTTKVSVGDLVNDEDVAARVEVALNAMTGFTALITTNDTAADGTMTLTQTGVGEASVEEYVEDDAGGDGAGSMGVTETTPGINATAAPTGTVWVSIPGANTAIADITGATTAAEVAAAFELALDGISGFTAKIVTDDSADDGTMTLTQTVRGITTDPDPHNADDTGVGSISTAETNAGVDIAADPTGAVWVATDYKTTISTLDLAGADGGAAIAARAETALNALTGFTAKITTNDTAADGTMTLTQVAVGATDNPVPHDDDDVGVGSITTTETTPGIAATAEPTGAVWATVAADHRAVADITGATTAAQVAAAFELALDGITGLSAVMTTDDTSDDGDMIITQAAVGVTTNPVPKDEDDSGAGSISTAETTPGINATAAPTGAVWASVNAANKAIADITGATTAAQVAAAFELALDGISGFTAKVVTDDTANNGTMTLTQTVMGVTTDPVPKDENDAGAGSISTVETQAGVNINTTAPTGALWAAADYTTTIHIGDLANDEDIAARAELALNALTGFTTAITTDDTAADGTMTLTQTAIGVVDNAVPKNEDDSGAGSIAITISTPGTLACTIDAVNSIKSS